MDDIIDLSHGTGCTGKKVITDVTALEYGSGTKLSLASIRVETCHV